TASAPRLKIFRAHPQYHFLLNVQHLGRTKSSAIKCCNGISNQFCGRSAMFELLETRSLLAVTLDPTTGILTVDGTSGPDRIGVRRQDANIVVVVNGTPSSFPADS